MIMKASTTINNTRGKIAVDVSSMKFILPQFLMLTYQQSEKFVPFWLNNEINAQEHLSELRLPSVIVSALHHPVQSSCCAIF